MLDLDQYYTPPKVAEHIVENYVNADPQICVDTTCGSGSLLQAASNVFDGIQCVGIDRDKKIISMLKRSQPHWILSVADLMKPSSYTRTSALNTVKSNDLLLLNPPFSQGAKKYVTVDYRGSEVKSSVAMAHILRSFDIFKPRHGAIVIVPESVLYSETDELARETLSLDYEICPQSSLDIKTFKGARVHSSVITITPKKRECSFEERSNDKSYRNLKVVNAEFFRGNLPVHELILAHQGRTFIHTTDLRGFSEGARNNMRKTKQLKATGIVTGWCILFPRVGLPDRNALKEIYLEDEVVLSDCVLAIQASSRNKILQIRRRISRYWVDFMDLYRGTGARYVTQRRILDWLSTINVNITNF